MDYGPSTTFNFISILRMQIKLKTSAELRSHLSFRAIDSPLHAPLHVNTCQQHQMGSRKFKHLFLYWFHQTGNVSTRTLSLYQALLHHQVHSYPITVLHSQLPAPASCFHLKFCVEWCSVELFWCWPAREG